MKFVDIIENLKRKEENKEKIILAKCGAFFVSVRNRCNISKPRNRTKNNMCKTKSMQSPEYQ